MQQQLLTILSELDEPALGVILDESRVALRTQNALKSSWGILPSTDPQTPSDETEKNDED